MRRPTTQTVAEARARVIDRLCDCEATAQHGHSSKQCRAYGMQLLDAYAAAIRQEWEAERIAYGNLIAEHAETESRLWKAESSVAKLTADLAAMTAQRDELVDRRRELKFDLDLIAAQLGLTQRCDVEPKIRMLLQRAEQAEAELAALRAQIAQRDWQPIETAPREPDADGLTPFVLLGFAPDETGYVLPTNEGFWNIWLKAWVKTLSMNFIGRQPTHWMPLPAPPKHQP